MLAEDPDELRVAAGLSHAKVRYLRSLAEHVLDGSLELDHLDELPDEEVIAQLVSVKGLGLWSAQMFLIIHLRRPGRASGRRPRDPQGDHEPLRVAGAARAGRDHRDRRTVASLPDARLAVPVAIASRDANLSDDTAGAAEPQPVALNVTTRPTPAAGYT